MLTKWPKPALVHRYSAPTGVPGWLRTWVIGGIHVFNGRAGSLFMLPTETKSGHLCRCGHPYVAHQHYRSGSECSQCPDCRHFRSTSGIIKQIIDRLTKFGQPLR